MLAAERKMRRRAARKAHGAGAGHSATQDRWLISYADFITLLFAFFVVLFAVSQVDARKVGRFAESVRVATRAPADATSAVPMERGPERGGGIFREGSATPITVRGRGALRGRLTVLLAAALSAQRVQIVDSPEGVVVRLTDASYFASGSASFDGRYQDEIRGIARALAGMNANVRVEGHTDARPLGRGAYRSNWELSAARGAAVLEVLVAEGLRSDRMSVAGYGSERPIASNDTEEGRAKNRRVDIVVIEQDMPAGGAR